jgi:hypothetical protein
MAAARTVAYAVAWTSRRPGAIRPGAGPGSGARVQGLYSNFASGIKTEGHRGRLEGRQLDPITATSRHGDAITGAPLRRRSGVGPAPGSNYQRAWHRGCAARTGVEGARTEFEKEPIGGNACGPCACRCEAARRQARAGLAAALGRLGGPPPINAGITHSDHDGRLLARGRAEIKTGVEHRRYRSSDGPVARDPRYKLTHELGLDALDRVADPTAFREGT